ncbi:MAG: NADPH:quinone oxidoreductase family protein [Nocardioidaceae bacterium]|nr:MAG: NADPH:quinone oxidoreductase family protein [Nocardioidaceae bacterium]
MRAVTVRAFGDLDAVAIEEHPDPVPAENEVLLEVRAAPVNYVDLVTMRGDYQFKPTLPYVPGKGPAGIVRQVGSAVHRSHPGDRVLAMAEYGGYAELATAEANQVHLLPAGLSFEDAATMSLAYDTAWMALRERARLAAGESVLVLGASGAVGRAAVSLARAMGAATVLGSVSRPGREVGPADGVVDLSRQPLRDTIREQVFALTDGRGVDVVIDPLGGDAFHGAIRALAWRGRLVVVGFAAGDIPQLKVNYTMLKNIEVSGLQISDYRKRVPELVRQCYAEVFEFYTEGRLDLQQAQTWPLAHWRDAVQALESRSATGRVVLSPQA